MISRANTVSAASRARFVAEESRGSNGPSEGFCRSSDIEYSDLPPGAEAHKDDSELIAALKAPRHPKAFSSKCSLAWIRGTVRPRTNALDPARKDRARARPDGQFLSGRCSRFLPGLRVCVLGH